MTFLDWILLFWETPEQQARRRRLEFLARMADDPDKTIAESLAEGARTLRRHGIIRDDDDLPKAA